jgi:hypothetical protein
MDERTMRLLLEQQQQLSNNVGGGNLQQTNFAAAANMSTTNAANGGGGQGRIGAFTQNDRITPPLPHAQQGHVQQPQQQQQRLIPQQQSQRSALPLAPMSATALPNNNNNLFAGIDRTQMMHLPQPSQDTILQRQYQATANQIAEENKARAVHIAGQQLVDRSVQHQHRQEAQNTDDNADADASDPLLASLQMYSQYGEDSSPLALHEHGFSATSNGGLPPPSSLLVDDRLQQLRDIQAQLSQLQRMERDVKQQAQAQEKQLQHHQQLQQQESSVPASTQSAGRRTPPNNDKAPLSPPSLPIDAAKSHAAKDMRAKVQQYEAAARSMLLQGQRRRSKIDAPAYGSAAAADSHASFGAPSPATIATAAVSSPQEQQRRRSSVVSNGSTSTKDTTGRKRRSSDQCWRDAMKDDPDVQVCRAKIRRRV